MKGGAFSALGRSSSRALLLFFLLFAEQAGAEEEPAGEVEPEKLEGAAWRFDVTSVSSARYSGDNRDTRSGEVETLVNDDFSALGQRLDTQAAKGPWSLSLRLDGMVYPTKPNPTEVGLDLVELRREEGELTDGEPSDPVYFRQKVYESGSELSNRYINWIIPAKYAVQYRTRDTQLSLGDFYAQFGRGLVLSVRKQDALASDTTLRGAKAAFGTRLMGTRLKGTVLFGSANPLRIDDASGRYLGVDSSVTKGFQLVTEAGMPRAIETDFAPQGEDCLRTATCTYAPDNLYGAQIQIAPKTFRLSTQASLLERHTVLTPDVIRGSTRVITGSQSLELPSLSDFGTFYLEGAGQSRSYEEVPSEAGYALYGTLDLHADLLALLIEAKHYRAFYPLSAGVNTANAREFNQIQYSQVPTAEPVWSTSQFENFNTCTSGGRAKLDVHLSDQVSVFSWLGRYNSWAESVANEECEISRENLNRVWDLATGTEISSRDHRSRTEISVGVRDDTTAREIGRTDSPTQIFYREAYTRYDALFHLSGPYSLQFQGWLRYQRQTIGGPLEPWSVGQTVNALDIANFGTVALGIEYDTDPRTPDTYFNGQLTYRMTPASSLSLFVGQRRGAQLCVAGVCRVFPPFEGARLDLTLRL